MNRASRFPIPEIDYLSIEQRKILDWHRMILQSNDVSLWLVDLTGVIKALEKYQKRNIVDYDRYFSNHLNALRYLASQLKIIDVNQNTLNLYGFSAKKQFLLSVPQRHTEDQIEVIKALVIALLKDLHYVETEATACHSNGEKFKVSIKLVIPAEVEGNTKVIASVSSLSIRNLAVSRLLAEKSIYQTFLNNAPVCIHEIDDKGQLKSMNPADLEMMQAECFADIKGTRYLDIVSLQDRQHTNYLMLRAFQGYSSEFEFELMTNSGIHVFSSCFLPIYDGGDVKNIIGVTQDITARKVSADNLYHMANYDLLTDLPNRRSFSNSVYQALQQASRHEHGLALLFIDIDDFKPINDIYGHKIGDQFLKEISSRIKKSLRMEDVVCRFGGDEFIVLLPNIYERRYIADVATKLLDVFDTPIDTSGVNLAVTSSIGIASYPEDGDNIESLISNADNAMYLAKKHGGNNYQFYQSDSIAKRKDDARLVN